MIFCLHRAGGAVESNFITQKNSNDRFCDYSKTDDNPVILHFMHSAKRSAPKKTATTVFLSTNALIN
jgi:hypothetical protein